MNKKLIGILLALAIPLAVNAEQAPSITNAPATQLAPPPPEAEFGKHHGKRMEMLTQELGLNDDQKSKMQAIFDEQKQKFKAIHEETRSRLRTVLTPEQFSKFESMHENKHHPKP